MGVTKEVFLTSQIDGMCGASNVGFRDRGRSVTKVFPAEQINQEPTDGVIKLL